jgi:hypothetical protein
MNIRIIAAGATVIAALMLSLAPVSAARCEGGGTCFRAKVLSKPLELNQFITPKASAKTATRKRGNKVQTAVAAPLANASDPGIGDAAPVSARVSYAEAGPIKTIESGGIAVISADEFNEIDAAADTVQVVAANDVSDMDLAADATSGSAPVEATATEAMASAEQPPADTSWALKLLAALGGMIAVASAARLLIA